MKELLIQINKRESGTNWFHKLYVQLQNEYKISVIEIEGCETERSSFFIDFSLKIESLYKQLPDECLDNNYLNTKNNAFDVKYDLALNFSSADLMCKKTPIIELYYRGQRLFDCHYLGIIEHLGKEATIDIDVVLSQGGKQALVEQAKYRGHWSALKNKALVYNSLPALFHKVIYKVCCGIFLQQTYTPSITNNRITFLTSVEYFVSSIHNICIKLYNSLGNKLFHTSGGQEWTVFIGKGNMLNAETSQLKPFFYPKGEFWADPFLFIHDDDLWLFFERFPYNVNKGIISCTKIVGGKPSEILDVLEKPYHLSYPNIFEDDNEIFMIPECSAAKRIEVYRCVEFPSKWELYSTTFEGESFADSVYFKDDNGEKWLFSSKESPVVVSHCNELWAYRIDSLKFNKIESHKQNPIVINACVARNGGTIYRENGKIYRASQDNSFEMYGNGVCISEITELSLDCYCEKLVKRIDKENVSGIIGLHHMNQINGFFVLDGRLK